MLRQSLASRPIPRSMSDCARLKSDSESDVAVVGRGHESTERQESRFPALGQPRRMAVLLSFQAAQPYVLAGWS